MTGSGNWELPGGAMEMIESLTDAAIREVGEETGFDIEVPYQRTMSASMSARVPSGVVRRCDGWIGRLSRY